MESKFYKAMGIKGWAVYEEYSEGNRIEHARNLTATEANRLVKQLFKEQGK